MDELRFFSPYADIVFQKNHLPHWQQARSVYFVTFRLADSLPNELRDEWLAERDAWLKRNPPPHTEQQTQEFQRLSPAKIEGWLDAGHGSCALGEPAVAKIIFDALQFFEGERCHQLAFVVMPNHVHALVSPLGNLEIGELIKSWKGYTSHTLKALLGERWPGWQKDYFDRLVRDAQHFERCVRYIRKNPAKARLEAGRWLLFESERARNVA